MSGWEKGSQTLAKGPGLALGARSSTELPNPDDLGEGLTTRATPGRPCPGERITQHLLPAQTCISCHPAGPGAAGRQEAAA